MKFRPEQDLNPDLCNAGAVLRQLSYQANRELVITQETKLKFDKKKKKNNCLEQPNWQ